MSAFGYAFSDLKRWQPKKIIVPYLKDMIHTCSEPGAQGHGMTFNMYYVGSNYPCFTSFSGKQEYLLYCGCSYGISLWSFASAREAVARG